MPLSSLFLPKNGRGTRLQEGRAAGSVSLGSPQGLFLVHVLHVLGQLCRPADHLLLLESWVRGPGSETHPPSSLSFCFFPEFPTCSVSSHCADMKISLLHLGKERKTSPCWGALEKGFPSLWQNPPPILLPAVVLRFLGSQREALSPWLLRQTPSALLS